MTNEEAIGILKFIKDINDFDPEMIDEDDVKALDIAIEALKKEADNDKAN